MKIKLIARPHNAPGCFLVRAEDGREKLFQSDWDFPGLAGVFGWGVADVRAANDCDHEGTDGTVSCPECGLKPGEFISDAADWLCDHYGEQAEDPGYFGN